MAPSELKLIRAQNVRPLLLESIDLDRRIKEIPYLISHQKNAEKISFKGKLSSLTLQL